MTDRLTTSKKKGISLPEPLLLKGLERAKEENRSFSSYVANLVAKDVNGQMKVPKADAAPAEEHAEQITNAA